MNKRSVSRDGCWLVGGNVVMIPISITIEVTGVHHA